MAIMTLKDIAGIMKHIDICMLTTMTKDGTHPSRPMSNNREVEYQGDAYFFANGDASAVSDIEANNQVNLAYIGHQSFLNRASVYISVVGTGELIREKSIMEKHWSKDVEAYFAQGIDTPGLTLIHVKANRIHYWTGMEEAEVALPAMRSAA